MTDTSDKSSSNSSKSKACSPSKNTPIDVLKDLPYPPDFYEKYVKQRRPVILRKCWRQLQGDKASSKEIPSVETLTSIVDTKTLVEANQRLDDNSTKDSFSPQHSTVVKLSFGDFLSKLQQKSSSYYMTTQTLPANEEGRPELYTTPMTELIKKSHCDLRPELLGNLIPVTYNLWMGATTSTTTKTSSGLHHDYHDNLYCIWEGCKILQLAPPQCVQKSIQTRGTLAKLHDNGRIVYQEQVSEDGGMIRPDGALEIVERVMELQIRQEEVEKQLDKDPDNEKLEEELERIQDELLDLERDGDDEEDEEEDASNLLFGGTTKADDDGDEDDVDNDDTDEEQDEEERESCQDEPDSKKRKLESNGERQLPLNFATNLPTDVSFETVELEKGDLLYLPAGWFHNVTSKGNPAADGIHMAMNYWMHPPDTDGTFEKPYVSEFWLRDWEARFS